MKSEFERGRERFEQAVQEWVKEAEENGPPAAIERAVLGQIGRLEVTRRNRRWFLAASMAAAVAIAWMGSLPTYIPIIPPAAADAEQPFVALPYVVQAAQNERTEVIRVNVPVAELIAVGLPVEGYPAGRAEADVLVGQDGRARAVRLIAVTE